MRARILTVALVAVFVAGCGGGDDTATDAATSTTTTTAVGEGSTETAGDTAPSDGGVAPAVPSGGCEGDHQAPVADERHDLAVDGVDRYYLLTAPEGEAEPIPLVVDLHGLLEGAEVQSMHSRLGEYGIEQGFATVFPNGSGEPVSWQVDADSSDLPYIDAVVEQVLAERCIDTSRVYATGLSMGAMMTSLLACERADTFAAFAPVNGLRLPEGCAPSRPVPLLTFHGTADPILLFNGGVDTSSFAGGEPGASATIPEANPDGEGYPATAEEWADLQGCTDPVDVDEPPVVDRTWTCPEGAAMEFVIIDGQGHGWPGSEFAASLESVMGPAVDGVDANERMWAFFQEHQLPAS